MIHDHTKNSVDILIYCTNTDLYIYEAVYTYQRVHIFSSVNISFVFFFHLIPCFSLWIIDRYSSQKIGIIIVVFMVNIVYFTIIP